MSLLPYLEIISTQEYKEFKKDASTEQRDKKVFMKLLKTFFKEKNSKISKRFITYTLGSNESKNLTRIDKKIISYLNENNYICNKENYLLGQCINKNNVSESILNVLTNIQSIDVNREAAKLDNPKVPEIGKKQAELRIKQKNNLEDSLVTYYKTLSRNKDLKIVFTWVPRKIASQSTSVGWTSCMDLAKLSGQNHYVWSGINNGAFIAWLVKTGDEFKLDNPLARVLIKPYKNKDQIYWWPEERVYGTPPGNFLSEVKEIIQNKQNTKGFKVGSYKLDKNKHYNDTNPQILITDNKEHYKKIIDATNYTAEQKDKLLERILNKNIKLLNKIIEALSDVYYDLDEDNATSFFPRVNEIFIKNFEYNSRVNYYDILNFAFANNKNENSSFLEKFVSHGRVNSIDLLYYACIFESKAAINAILKVHKLEFESLPYTFDSVVDQLIYNSNLELIKYLFSKLDIKVGSNSVGVAAREGDFEVFKYIVEKRKNNSNGKVFINSKYYNEQLLVGVLASNDAKMIDYIFNIMKEEEPEIKFNNIIEDVVFHTNFDVALKKIIEYYKPKSISKKLMITIIYKSKNAATSKELETVLTKIPISKNMRQTLIKTANKMNRPYASSLIEFTR